MRRSQRRGEEILHSSFADSIRGGGCVRILVVHAVFVIPSGNENRNFYCSLDIATGKLVRERQLSLIFIENK